MTEAPCPPDVGTVLAGRYRLLELLGKHESGSTTVWRAEDDILARPVTVKVWVPGDGLTGSAFIDAAVSTGRVCHAGLASVYDAAEVDGTAYVVSEWVDGTTLAALINRVGPLDAHRAARIVGQVADAVASAHALGIAHGSLHPSNVLVTMDDTVKVTDIGGTVQATPTEDIRHLGALLYATLTGRWPLGEEAVSLPPAPTSLGVALAPHRVRAGIPDDLDQLAMTALTTPEQLTGEEFTRAIGPVPSPLAALPDQFYGPPDPVGGPYPDQYGDQYTRYTSPYADGYGEPPPPRRSWRRAMMFLAVALILAGGGWLLGVTVMGFNDLNPVKNASGPKPPPSPTHAATKNITVNDVNVLDPTGDDTGASKNLANLHDGDQTTLWKTDGYTKPDFGHQMKGMALVFDLGSPTSVKKITITSLAPGASVQLFASDTPETLAGDSPETKAPVGTPLAINDNVGDGATDLVLPQAKRYRYWTLWFTKAGPGTGKDADPHFTYRLMIGEVRFGG
ncbi:MAG: protein kinase family protein [Mycobacteriales bacterium]